MRQSDGEDLQWDVKGGPETRAWGHAPEDRLHVYGEEMQHVQKPERNSHVAGIYKGGEMAKEEGSARKIHDWGLSTMSQLQKCVLREPGSS